MILRAATPERFFWLTERSGYVPLPDARGIEAVSRGVVRGMVVFDGFTETLATMHVALDTPSAAWALLRPSFRYAFGRAGREGLITVVHSDNAAVVRLAAGVGFRERCRVKDGPADLIFYELRREECRYLEVH